MISQEATALVKGIWFVVSQFGPDGLLRHLVSEEKKDKAQVGKKNGDWALTGGETRKQHQGGDCINIVSGASSLEQLEPIEALVGRAIREELGIEKGYKWKPVGLMDVDQTKTWENGKIGSFPVLLVHALLDQNVDVSNLKPADPDTSVVGAFRPKELFNGTSHRAGSITAYKILIGRQSRHNDTIIQATRYEPETHSH